MASFGFAIGLLLAPAPEPSAAADPPAVRSPVSTITTVALRIAPEARSAFVAALALRSPGLRVVAFGDRGRSEDGGFAYVEVAHPLDMPDRARLNLILPDGRAWIREVPLDPDEPLRPVATALSHLLAAIAEDTVAPDARDVPMPEPPSPAPAPAARPSSSPPPRPPNEVAVVGSGGAAFGIGPPNDVSAVLGGAASLGLEVRTPSSLTIGFDARLLERRRDDDRFHRARMALGLGATPRWGAFELPTLVSVTVEPWWVRRSGDSTPLSNQTGGEVDAAPLLGAAIRVSPSYRHVFPGGLALRVGIRVELAGSSLPSGTVLRLSRDEPERGLVPIFRAGGFEAFVGPEVALWIPASRPR